MAKKTNKEQDTKVVGDTKPTTTTTPLEQKVANTDTATVELGKNDVPMDKELVKIKIEYPKNWKQKRYFRDGEVIELDPISAKSTIDFGIAKLVK